jgi:hypothetical protein
MFDLEQFLNTEIIEPTLEDFAIFREILNLAQNQPVEARIKDLEKAIAPVIKSNQAERQTLLQILGYCGILENPAYPSFSAEFIPVNERVTHSEWNYPVYWWRGEQAINFSALGVFFAEYSELI